MPSSYATVAERARHRCEYCQAPELVFNFPFEVEHITPFQVDPSGRIIGISPIGQVTVTYLEMNSIAQVTARLLWIRLDLFP